VGDSENGIVVWWAGTKNNRKHTGNKKHKTNNKQRRNFENRAMKNGLNSHQKSTNQ